MQQYIVFLDDTHKISDNKIRDVLKLNPKVEFDENQQLFVAGAESIRKKIETELDKLGTAHWRF